MLGWGLMVTDMAIVILAVGMHHMRRWMDGLLLHRSPRGSVDPWPGQDGRRWLMSLGFAVYFCEVF
jgi:hypothetical protein